MTLGERIREDMMRERTLEENNKRELDRQIGQEYSYCPNCGTRVGRSQYGSDDYCPRCKTVIDWRKGK